MAKSLYLIGATGTVGRGVARIMINSGWNVLAIARNTDRLAALKSELPGLITIAGTVDDERAACSLATYAADALPNPDVIVTAINLPTQSEQLSAMSAARLMDVFSGNVVSHHNAIRAFLPVLGTGGRYIGIGGGMADLIFEGMGAISMGQAALRNAYRFYARENEGSGRFIEELMIYSQIVDPAEEATADPRRIRADEVGVHIKAMLDQPSDFPGPIHVLKSRKQIGMPPLEK